MDIKIKFEIEIAGQKIVLTKEEFDELKKKMTDIERSFSTQSPVDFDKYKELRDVLTRPSKFIPPQIPSLPWRWDKDTLTNMPYANPNGHKHEINEPIWVVDFDSLARY